MLSLPTILLAAMLLGGAAPAPRKVLILDLRAVGVEAALAQQATRLVAEPFNGQEGFQVLTVEDIKELLGAEQLRTMTGCESNSCLADLSKGANADLVINGTVGRVGDKLTVSLALLDSNTASVKDRATATVSHPKELPQAIANMVATMFGWIGAQAPRFKLPAGQKMSFAVLDLIPSGVNQEVTQSLTQILSVEIKRIEGTSVISRDDIQAMLQVEETKTKLGCDDASCLAEIGGALGVEKLVVGSVGKLADSFVISLRLISTQAARVDSRVSESFTGGEEQLIRAIRHCARRLLGIDAADPGTLAITASEEGSRVIVDGTQRGKIPMKPLSLSPGPHQVSVQKSGHLDWNGDVYVDPGDTTALWVELRAKPLKWYQKWWVWTVMGTAAGAGAIALVVALGGATAGTVAAYQYFSQPEPSTATGKATVK